MRRQAQFEASNVGAARVILADPDRNAGALLEWARLVLDRAVHELPPADIGRAA